MCGAIPQRFGVNEPLRD